MSEGPEHRSGIVSLLTDFGVRDTYVGQVKAVILGIASSARLVDLTHDVPPQDVVEGAFHLAAAWQAFPPGTVHLAVVDPGVGTARRPVALEWRGHLFVVPDNGLISFVLGDRSPDRLVVLDRPRYHRPNVSSTFHGRDLFGPVAAYLASRLPLQEVGAAADPTSLARLDFPSLRRDPDAVRAPVVSIDHFGNCRTLIRREDIPWPLEHVWVRCGQAIVRGIVDTYGSVPETRTLALFGSYGGLEVAVRSGSAARAWDIRRGSVVAVSPGT